MSMLDLVSKAFSRGNRSHWVALLVMLVVPALASAIPAASHTTDLSIKYLGQIFGNVPGALLGGGTGLLSGLFKIFNQGVMAVAAIWLIYSITQVILFTAANEQSHMVVKNWLMWFRMALGFVLLVPMPGTGYCIAQELMMKVVVAGIDLADNTWSYTLNYLEKGNTFFTPPNLVTGGLNAVKNMADVTSQFGNLIGSKNNKANNRSFLYSLYNNEVCMYVSNALEKKNLAPALQHIHRMQFVQPIMSNGVSEQFTGEINFPGYGDPANQGNGCGVITLPTQMSQPMPSSILTKYNTQALADQAFGAMTSAALAMEPLAQMVAKHVTSSGTGQGYTPSVDQPLGKASLFQAFYNYYTTMKVVTRNIETSILPQSLLGGSFFTQADSEGWFNAGNFYWELVRWSNLHAMVESGDPNKWQPINEASRLNSAVQNDVTLADTILNNGIWTAAQQDIVQLATGRTNNDFNSTNQNPVLAPVMMGIVSGPLDTLVGKMNTYINSNNIAAYNPMLVSYHMGKYCLGAAGWIWTIMVGVITPIAVASGVCTAASPGAVIFKALMNWAMPLVIAITTMLFAAGAMLVFYVPLYPCLVFLFGVIGWLLYVVESMVAAPLVAFGMTHPNGQDFLGRAEQSLMLALGVFLKPTLMIIGYIVSIILVYVVSGFLNTVLGQLFTSTFGQTYNPSEQGPAGIFYAFAGGAGAPINSGAFTSNPVSDTLCVPIIMVLYSTIMIEAANQCFSAIHQVPDMVLRWIGGPQGNGGQQIAQSLGAIRGAVQGVGQQMGDFGGKAASSAAEGMTKAGAEIQENKEDGASGDATATGGGESADVGEAAKMIAMA